MARLFLPRTTVLNKSAILYLMKLILAQGNPGAQYHDTRHNVGFRVLDVYAHAHGATFAEKSKFHAYIAECSVHDEKVLLVKPTTFYNETGLSARALVDFYKLSPATDVLVLHDDIALPLGTIRTREKGSDAGNNGIKSLNAHLGDSYKRVRIGVWNELADRMGATKFVLGNFAKEEQAALAEIRPTILEIIDTFIAEEFAITSYKTSL